MSGKSTLMRSVGLNSALAMAGGPVHAVSLELAPLAVGATLRIQDSLSAGISRFYAEITRLRQLVDLARGPRPVLFLIDEILAGTNSHDRRLGAAAVLRGLVDLGAIGIASTHDLALTGIVDELPGRALNLHFEDHLEGARLKFDYRLRPGVVQHSNALALMRAVGLEV
jgi:DNA mismatch repair ATPase MutS